MFFGATHIKNNSRVLLITSRTWSKIGSIQSQGKNGQVDLHGYSSWKFDYERNPKELKITSWNDIKSLEISCLFKNLSFPKLNIKTSEMGSFELKLRKKIKIELNGCTFKINSSDPISSNPILLLRQLICLGLVNFDYVVKEINGKDVPEEIIMVSILIRGLIFPIHYSS